MKLDQDQNIYPSLLRMTPFCRLLLALQSSHAGVIWLILSSSPGRSPRCPGACARAAAGGGAAAGSQARGRRVHCVGGAAVSLRGDMMPSWTPSRLLSPLISPYRSRPVLVRLHFDFAALLSGAT